MKKRILIIASIAVLVVAATVFALAQGHMGGPGKEMHGGPEEMIEHISRELNLTDAQKTQAKAIFEAQKSTEDARHAKLEDIRKQIDAATANGQFDESVIRPLANQQAALMADEMVDHIRLHSQLFSLLTDEQKTKALEMMKRHGGPGGPGGPDGEGRHHGGPPPPPPGF